MYYRGDKFMISYVKLKNYISFGDITFDFRRSKGKIKNFVALYGENGSGKTNFIKSIRFLVKNINSLNYLYSRQKLLERLEKIEKEKDYIDFFKTQFLKPYDLFGESHMTECNEPTELEYGFRYKNHNGIYHIVFSDHIIEESLKYWTGKQTGELFRLFTDKENNIKSKFNSNLFLSKQSESDVLVGINKFWGKHSFLSIVFNQLSEQNEIYSRNNYSPYLLDALEGLSRISVITNDNDGLSLFMYNNQESELTDLSSGNIPKQEEPLLIHWEAIIRSIFTQIYADIKDVKYELNDKEKRINYKLTIDKMIDGKVRNISIDNESSGTKQILRIISTLLGALEEVSVFIDEADTGIHDILFNNIIDAIKEKITGQLVFTTHNTTLLEKISPNEAYIISSDYDGKKEAVCISDFKLQKTNNPRSIYLKGLLGGVPVLDKMDVDFVINELNKSYHDKSIKNNNNDESGD